MNILAWEIPWTEEPGELRSVGLQNQTRLSTHVRWSDGWLLGQQLFLSLVQLDFSELFRLLTCPVLLTRQDQAEGGPGAWMP